MADASWDGDELCLVCGPKNPSGLNLRFFADAEGARAEGSVPEHLQGYHGTTHGGIVAAILDEAMYYAIAAQGSTWVATGELTVRYHRPLPCGTPFSVEAQCLRSTRRFAKACASLRCEGAEVATATGLFLPVPHHDQGPKGE